MYTIARPEFLLKAAPPPKKVEAFISKKKFLLKAKPMNTHVVAHLEFQTEDRTSEEYTHKHTHVCILRIWMSKDAYIWIKRADVYMFMHTRSIAPTPNTQISGVVVGD
jgi:hypothetical protein